MFPVDPATKDYDKETLAAVGGLTAGHRRGSAFEALLPQVLCASEAAGSRRRAPRCWTGALGPGIPLGPPKVVPVVARTVG